MKNSPFFPSASLARLPRLLMMILLTCKAAASPAATLQRPVLGGESEVVVSLAELVPPGSQPPTTAVIDTPPLHGTLTPGSAGFIYRPAESFRSLGSDSFTVELDGGSEVGGVATVQLLAKLHGREQWSDNFEASALAEEWALEDPAAALLLTSFAALQGSQGLRVPAPGAVLTYPNCLEPPPSVDCDPPDGGGEQGGGTVITLRVPSPPPPLEGGGQEVTLYEAGPAELPSVDLRLRASSVGAFELAASALDSSASGGRRFTPWFPLSQRATRVRLDSWFEGPASSGGLRLWLDDRAVARLTDLENAGGSFAVQRLGSWGEGTTFGFDLDQVRLHRASVAESSASFLGAVTLFAADFESADLSSWSAGPFPAALRVEEAAALSGRHGLVVNLDEGGAALSKDVEAGEAANLRLRLAAGSAQLPQNQGFKLLTGKRSSGAPVLELWLRLKAAVLQLQAVAIDDAGQRRPTSWLPITSNSAHAVELQWRASTGPQAGNGLLRLWLNGVLSAGVSGLDNSDQRLSNIVWGAEAVPAGSGGELYLDGLEIWR